MSPGRGDAGSASVLVVVLTGVLTVLALGGSAMGSVVVAQRRAASAADLAALAGAESLARTGDTVGQATACAEAARISAANGARAASCVVTGRVVTVAVTVDTAPVLGLRWEAVERARAGPWPSLP